ncbi:MAG TPA: hypothetical protein VK912_00915 [Longimicrobiales bacterium]|nr:hypothetical protein [Longimicrobiales bacterium]
MPDLSGIQSQIGEARARRDRERAALRTDTLALHALDDALAHARRAAGPDDEEGGARIAKLERERSALEERIEGVRADLVGSIADERRLAGELLPPPQVLIEQMPDLVPILLLPVHIETRFMDTDGGPELWLRIYPDDIAVAAHERVLSAGEAEDGRTYWRARAAANALADEQARTNEARGAWNVLAGRHGAHRAAWIAHETRPTNWTDGVDDPAALAFPELETKPLDATEVPRSEVLPDRFVAVLFTASGSREFVGGLIPDDLPLGPDPLGAEGLLERDPDTGRIAIDDAMRWMIDFPAAVARGMGMRIPLEPQERDGLTRIVVLGLRASSSPADTAARLQRLIEAHRYGTGMAIVPQGTPTNNTDDAKSGFTSSNEDDIDALWPEQAGAALPVSDDPLEQTDGQRLAESLGLPVDVIAPLPFAARTDIAEAIAMNRALWGATLGGFVTDVLKPLVRTADSARLQRYFTAFVLGRGLLPTIRVGDQPYGVLITSSFPRWKFHPGETRDEGGFWAELEKWLRRLEGEWRTLLPLVPFTGRPGAEPFANLMGILGLQASSVEFYTRRGIDDEYLWNYVNFLRMPAGFAARLYARLRAARDARLAALGIGTSRLHTIAFLEDDDRLTGPVIDGDPRIPLSEEAQLRTIDGTRNYIDWLLTAPRGDIRSERFRDADGAAVPAPTALLYQQLRHAYLTELGRSSVLFLKVRAAAIFAELPDERPLANIDGPRSLTTADMLEVDAARIGVTRASTPVADYLLTHARSRDDVLAIPPEAAALADVNEALHVLAKLPTARLERCFAEHLDVCSYRLDAWIQGLFARRLALLRAAAAPALNLTRVAGAVARPEAAEGIHIGAYGWVEDVKPSTAERRTVALDSVPEPLRAELDGDIVEYENSGGYVHAPSLTHAVTAAVLRNAFLTHADRANPNAMSVNLASSRVRVALSYLEGLRNGQELGALLGYQLERGMHENPAELDEFVYVLRDRFPFVSRKLTPVPDGTSAELAEARDVINGYDLLEFVRGKDYPYGIAGLPADPRGSAIRAEIDSLADALDALGDLVLAESVHQVVQGNYERARGILQIAEEGSGPAEMDVATTPRSGRSLTHRVALHLDPQQSTGWNAGLSPRAAANAALNHWLMQELPAAADIQWQVTLGGVSEFVAFDAFGLEPLDVVLLSGDRFGDRSSELERLIIYAYRSSNDVADDVQTFVAPDIDTAVPASRRLVFDFTAAQPGRRSLASILPLLTALRRLLGAARPLHAADHALPSEGGDLDAADPHGWDDGALPLRDLAELKARIETAHTDLDAAHQALDGIMAGGVRAAYQALKEDPDRVIVPQWSTSLPAVRHALESIVAFGFAEALPTGGRAVTEANIDALVAQAESVIALVGDRLGLARKRLDIVFADPLPTDPGEAARTRAFRTDQRLEAFTEAARALLGRTFTPVPLFRLQADQRNELATAFAAPITTDGNDVENWMQSLARVREPMGHLMWLLTYHDWLHPAPRTIQPIQLPARAGDRWIGSEYGDALGPGDVMSITLLGIPGDLDAPLCGLLLDEWTEVVPGTRETTGIALHANRPNAVAPQALLLAVAPELRGTWRWDDLVSVVTDTLDRAQLRAVEPDMIATTEFAQLLPTTMSEFGTGGTLVSTVLARNDLTVLTRSP